jgi:hypothetical protein
MHNGERPIFIDNFDLLLPEGMTGKLVKMSTYLPFTRVV